MATGTIQLPVGGAVPADGSASNSFPAISILTSSDADNPKVRRMVMAFDDTTNETVCWGFRLPSNYASGGTLKGNWYPAGANTTKYVIWRAALQAVTPGDSTSMLTLDPVNAGGGWATTTEGAVATAAYPDNFSITLAMNSAAAGDSIAIMFQRNAADGGDDAVGDAIILDELHLEYTTA